MKKRKNRPAQSQSVVAHHSSQADPPNHPAEHAKVWSKIADRRVAQKEESFFFTSLADELKRVFSSPHKNSIIAAVVILAGFYGGWLHGNSDKKHLSGKLQSEYISSISPYSHPKGYPR